MDAPAGTLVVLDAVSAVLTLAVAAYFLRLWSGTRHPLHLLFSLGLALVGASYTTVSASAFDLGHTPEGWDQLRIAGQVGGALVIFFAYTSARSSNGRPYLALGYAAAGLSLLFAILYFAIPPVFTFPDMRTALVISHFVTTFAWLASAVLAVSSVSGWGPDRLLVPMAFVAFAVSKYSWLLQDISGDPILIPYIYPWRFLGIVLLLAALLLPRHLSHPEDMR
jgi:hypothetical protein